MDGWPASARQGTDATLRAPVEPVGFGEQALHQAGNAAVERGSARKAAGESPASVIQSSGR